MLHVGLHITGKTGMDLREQWAARWGPPADILRHQEDTFGRLPIVILVCKPVVSSTIRGLLCYLFLVLRGLYPFRSDRAFPIIETNRHGDIGKFHARIMPSLTSNCGNANRPLFTISWMACKTNVLRLLVFVGASSGLLFL